VFVHLRSVRGSLLLVIRCARNGHKNICLLVRLQTSAKIAVKDDLVVVHSLLIERHRRREKSERVASRMQQTRCTLKTVNGTLLRSPTQRQGRVRVTMLLSQHHHSSLSPLGIRARCPSQYGERFTGSRKNGGRV
jgi:hypothetical protein